MLYSAISKSNFIGIFVSYCTVTTFCFYDFDALFLTFDFSCVAPNTRIIPVPVPDTMEPIEVFLVFGILVL